MREPRGHREEEQEDHDGGRGGESQLSLSHHV